MYLNYWYIILIKFDII